jgi:signal transduction histidine kinase
MVDRAAEAAADLAERMVRPTDPAGNARCDANAVLGELLDLLLPVAPKGVVFERAFDPTLPPLAIGDDELRQIALNLVVNAWQALSERGGRVRVVTQRARDRGVVEVSDDGGGIDESVLERMFEPFFSTRAGGRGLGLATVQLLLRRTGGDVRVTSRPGGGTSFVVGLPLAREG